MFNKISNSQEDHSNHSSRRNFFKQFGNIVGAITAASVIEIKNMSNVFAASTSNTNTYSPNVVHPNCIPCPEYGSNETVCLGKNDSLCGSGLYHLQVWNYTGGCIHNSTYCCPHNVIADFCSTNCGGIISCKSF